ncbi:MAG: chorismate mutase [Candidatus Methanofastidiosa archaeon]|nr:chorismate mutase [Candidatus Methanofastidiosa archaeon]
MEELKALRRKIDEIDSNIIENLCLRMEIAKRIGDLKKSKGIDIKDIERERVVERHWEELARLNEIPPNKLMEILRNIIELSSYVQEGP